MINQEHLKETLHYDPETGIFIHRLSKGKAKKGKSAGHKSNLGYIVIMIDGTNYRAHRLVWFYIHGVWPKDGVDHINHIKDDNRLVNLREATQQENTRNSAMRKDNTSGVTGVYWYKRGQKWRSSIRVNERSIHLGCYDDKDDAIKARIAANIKYGFHPNHGRIT